MKFTVIRRLPPLRKTFILRRSRRGRISANISRKFIPSGYEEPEIGFIIGVPWQRKGYAEEVCRAILNYGREVLGFGVIQAFVRPGNDASLKLCRKLGFHDIGVEELEGEEHIRLSL